MVNIINVFDPDFITIGDIMIDGGSLMLDEIKKTVFERSFPFRKNKPDILYSVLGTETVLYGAGAVAIDYVLNNFDIISERLDMKKETI